MRRTTIRSAIAFAIMMCAASAPALAQDASEKEIERYRAMISDPMSNPGYLAVDRGEVLWSQKRGTKDASLETCDLEPRELMLVRIAALAAVDAPPVSYLANAGTASDVGVTLDDVEGVLVAVALLMGGWVEQLYGWRAVFAVAGAPGILLALLMRFTVKEPPRGRFDGPRAAASPANAPTHAAERWPQEEGAWLGQGRILFELSRLDQAMRDILAEIQSGEFTRKWINENHDGLPRMEAFRKAERAHQSEEVGGRLRAMMPFLGAKRVAGSGRAN